jgi:hypothetical protein
VLVSWHTATVLFTRIVFAAFELAWADAARHHVEPAACLEQRPTAAADSASRDHMELVAYFEQRPFVVAGISIMPLVVLLHILSHI